MFKSQMRRIGRPDKPFYVVVSKDDKALGASSFLGGKETRVGDVPNDAELAALGATVIDLTDVKADDPTNHGKFAQLAEVAPSLLPVLGQGVGARPGSSAQAESLRGNVGTVVSLPATFLGATVNIIRGE